MTRDEAIDALGDGIDCLDEMKGQSLLLDEGQAQMVAEARRRIAQVQTELIEEALSEEPTVDLEAAILKENADD